MDPSTNLTNELFILTHQLRMRKMANEHHQRARSQVRNPHMSTDHVRYRGTPYLSNLNIGWAHHSSPSWEERQDGSHSSHVQRSSLEDTIAELARSRVEMEESRAQMAKESLEKTMAEVGRSQDDLVMVQVQKESSMDDMDYSQVGFPRLSIKNEMNQPP